MIVTPSRLHAVRYMKEFIKEKGYTVTDDDKEYTVPSMNVTKNGEQVKEIQLKETFHGDDFNLLIVAGNTKLVLMSRYFIQCLSIKITWS
ncbi:hypothetical protein QNN00_04195 [Bacillus velezensis]|nr:hypothetical protein [Bacillus velezensis]